ncbi:MAG: acetyl-CoA carboxylase biotin carboxylase subunit [Alphaproteobacteria bacterium]|nr:acetyl-CoA carboxylase biotin carboxylase subunit [Alphaproteobacteria bacterium]
MFKKILIANRGEIAVRIERACKELGIPVVAVHSTADADAMHVRLAEESVCIGGPSAKNSYLNIPSILTACEITGADAIHPGYGFLSENARFAEILEYHGITFIGPTAEHIRIMGDKIKARATAIELGFPIIPGSDRSIESEKEAQKIADEIGYPILIKATAGGGGRGMKIVHKAEMLAEAMTSARNEAQNAFGENRLYLEKYLSRPRHIEVQILADGKGNALHFGERDCSLQRRHQKIWEEAPSSILSETERTYIGNLATKAMKKINYRGVGTIELLYENKQFYFIEMNTRIQVEHPVTEMITGIDLITEQIKVAAGIPLKKTQEEIQFNGHSIECRINAESSDSFLPSPGKINYFHSPGGFGVRIDSGAYQGYFVPPFYDSLIAKLIVWGKDRSECIARLRRSLDEFVIDGIETTIPLLKKLTRSQDIIRGEYDTHWLEEYLENEENLSLSQKMGAKNPPE